MRREAETSKQRKLSRGALVGFALAVVAVGWLLYAFLGELAPPPATQWVGDLEISLYSTLAGRPRVGDNQFEVKLRDRQGQPVSQAEVGWPTTWLAWATGAGWLRGPQAMGFSA